MTITYRLVKGSALTHAELDGNFIDLDTKVGLNWVEKKIGRAHV